MKSRFDQFLEDKKLEISTLGEKAVIPYLLEDWNKVEDLMYEGLAYKKSAARQFNLLERIVVLGNALKALSRLRKISNDGIYHINVLHRRDSGQHQVLDGQLVISTNLKGSHDDIIYIGSILAVISVLARQRKDRAQRWRLFDTLVRKLVIRKFDVTNLKSIRTCTYYDWFNLSLFSWANSNGIHTIERQHGLLYPHPYYSDLGIYSSFFPKRLEIWGDNWLVDNGFPSSVSNVVRHDLNNVSLAPKPIEYDFLVVGGCRLDIIHWITKNLRTNKVLYRPHPAEDLSVCNSLLSKNVEISNPINTSLSQDIFKCEKVLGVASTVLLECCLYNRPASLIPLQGSEYMETYGLKYFPMSSILPVEKFFTGAEIDAS